MVVLKAPVQSDAGFPDDLNSDHLHNNGQLRDDAVDPLLQSARSSVQILHGLPFQFHGLRHLFPHAVALGFADIWHEYPC